MRLSYEDTQKAVLMYPTAKLQSSQSSKYLLDLFSTSQTFEKCVNNAPYLCIPPDGVKSGYLMQGCCNDWTCPRCGKMRAKHEYGRIVEGARKIVNMGLSMYFVTLTCPGDITPAEAEQQYYKATNRLLTTLRRKTEHWFYSAVTERQKRGHPHSHFLTTACPKDAFYAIDDYSRYLDQVVAINAVIPHQMRYTAIPEATLTIHDLHSTWLQLEAVKVGLGVQARISEVDTVEGCSRYVAKYLFKQCMSERWPKGWRRVRYSRSWPKLPDVATTDAFPVLRAYDWHKVSLIDGEVVCKWKPTYEKALSMGCYNVALHEE